MTIVKHLDRVMESDAGHAAKRARRHEPIEEHEEHLVDPSSPDEELAREQVEEAIRFLEGDERALEVLRLKGEGFTASQIRENMALSEREYDTVGRRIRRLRERLARGGD